MVSVCGLETQKRTEILMGTDLNRLPISWVSVEINTLQFLSPCSQYSIGSWLSCILFDVDRFEIQHTWSVKVLCQIPVVVYFSSGPNVDIYCNNNASARASEKRF